MTDLPDPPSYDSITQRAAPTTTPFPVIARTNSSTPSIVHDDPLTLTWNDGSQVLGPAAAVEAHLLSERRVDTGSTESYRSGSFSGFNAVAQSARPTVGYPNITPPPPTNLKFIFSPVGTSGMALIPWTESGYPQEGQNRYFITVAVNCFMPLSHITTIYQGNNELGTRIGYFEGVNPMGTVIGPPAYLRIGDHPKEYISDVITKDSSRKSTTRWKWRGHSVSYLVWDYGVIPFTCSAPVKNNPDYKIVAKFRSHLPSSTKSRPREQIPDYDTSVLDVTPLGHKCFNDIECRCWSWSGLGSCQPTDLFAKSVEV
ncbi:hypothetical protein D9619_002303 [Psilocybe cf. subviscida]|uniref:Uncharacterized protein n=1 Tax=Psilocybe cf. subviscida TaxID=2480587 RepID=A0A8H5AXB1_9AGAR|nr:hypothetical protein D9619_002303 [Psilocybe cf. subviscida]